MIKSQELISKIQIIKNFQNLKENPYPDYNAGILSPAELELILDALENMQFLEILHKARNIKQETN